MLLLGLIQAFDKVEAVQTEPDNYAVTLTGLSLQTIDLNDELGRVILVDATRQFQTITGFGSAYTETAAYNYYLMPDAVKTECVEALVGQTGLKLNWGRLHIGSADFSISEYSCVQEGDQTLDTFNLDRDNQYVIPFVKDLVKVQPDITLFGSPWSPPSYMKDNGRLTYGGHLLPNYWDLWGRYNAKWVASMRDEGIPIRLLTVQNEPMANQTFESCVWTAEEEGKYAVQNLRPALDSAGLKDVGISVWDHNRDICLDRAKGSFGVQGAKGAIEFMAFHWYAGAHWEQVDLIHELYNPRLFVSEFCAGGGFPGLGDWSVSGRRYVREFMGALNHWCEAITDWNAITDEVGGPYHNRVGGTKGPLMFNTEAKTFSRTPMYWAVYHFSHFIDRGAKRLWFSSPSDLIRVTAAQNPDGSVIVVVLNDGDTITEWVGVDGQFVEIHCPAESVTTVRFS